MQPDLTEKILELIRRTSTNLPADVEERLRSALEKETPGSAARGALETVLKNVELSRAQSTPICQDTGTPIFYVYYPVGWSTRKLKEQIRSAMEQATKRNYMRPNAVDAIYDKNSGNNLGGEDLPSVHFEEVEGDQLTIELMLKGGGCENVGAQYSLPDNRLGAGRDRPGCALCWMPSKGSGSGLCAWHPVAIGGDRGSSYYKSGSPVR
jgi:fumarate hydratase class I